MRSRPLPPIVGAAEAHRMKRERRHVAGGFGVGMLFALAALPFLLKGPATHAARPISLAEMERDSAERGFVRGVMADGTGYSIMVKEPEAVAVPDAIVDERDRPDRFSAPDRPSR